MITSDAFAPDYRLFRMEGRLWCELRGFWDVHGDFMGGPFVSYTTVDTATTASSRSTATSTPPI